MCAFGVGDVVALADHVIARICQERCDSTLVKAMEALPQFTESTLRRFFREMLQGDRWRLEVLSPRSVVVASQMCRDEVGTASMTSCIPHRL